MTRSRFLEIASNYPSLRIAVVGDFCLDRYLEIDPAKAEKSIETKLAVHNVVHVRGQPGGAGTILNNLLALGVGQIFPVGFCGADGEGYELQLALRKLSGVSMEHFFASPLRRTFTYTKPLVIRRGMVPKELSRLDLKNWTPTPVPLQKKISGALKQLAKKIDAIIVLDQVDVPQTGVVTNEVLQTLGMISRANPKLFILADSRRGLRGFPPLAFKVNQTELATSLKKKRPMNLKASKIAASSLAKKNAKPLFVTLAEKGILGVSSNGEVEHVSSLPIRDEIDIVGAGDSVTANLTAALTSGASLKESVEIANAAASIVIHKLGTTGTANVTEIKRLLKQSAMKVN